MNIWRNRGKKSAEESGENTGVSEEAEVRVEEVEEEDAKKQREEECDRYIFQQIHRTRSSENLELFTVKSIYIRT